MTGQALPRDDQPDRYTGCWNQVHISTVYPDTAAGVWHLSMPEKLRGSYCGTFNRIWRCELAGAQLQARDGGIITISPQGATVGQIIRALAACRFRGEPLEFCPSCLTLARAEAELVSQRKYGVRGLLKQFDGAATPPA